MAFWGIAATAGMIARAILPSVIGESFQEMIARTLGGSSITQYVYVDLDFRWPGGSSSVVPQVSATMSFNTIAEAVFMDTVKPMTGFGTMIDLGQIINGIVDLGFNMSRAVKRRRNKNKGGEADNTAASESSSYITDTRTAQCQECCKQISTLHNNHAVDCHTNRPTQLDKTRCRYVHASISEFLGSNMHTTKWWLTKIGSRRKLSVERFQAMLYGNFDNVQEYILASCDETSVPWCQAEKMCQHMAVSCFGSSAEEDGAVVVEDSDNIDDNDGRRRVGGGSVDEAGTNVFGRPSGAGKNAFGRPSTPSSASSGPGFKGRRRRAWAEGGGGGGEGGGGGRGGGANAGGCCITCARGKACGDACIAREKVCSVPKGCACDTGK
jgi:hypothetical protein